MVNLPIQSNTDNDHDGCRDVDEDNDDDNDGFEDQNDQCPTSRRGAEVNSVGCEISFPMRTATVLQTV